MQSTEARILFNQSVNFLNAGENDLAITSLETALEIAQKEGDIDVVAHVYLMLAKLSSNNINNFEATESWLTQAANYANNLNLYKIEFIAYKSLGEIYENKYEYLVKEFENRFDKSKYKNIDESKFEDIYYLAINFYKKAYLIAQKSEISEEEIAELSKSLGILMVGKPTIHMFNSLKSNDYSLYKESIPYLKISLDFYVRFDKYRHQAHVYVWLGYAYAKDSDIDRSQECFEKAKEIFESLNDQENINKVKIALSGLFHPITIRPFYSLTSDKANICDVFVLAEKQEISIARAYAFQIIKIEQEQHNDKGIVHGLAALAFTFIKENKISEAIDIYQKSLTLSRKVAVQSLIGRMLDCLAYAYELIGDYSSSLRYYQERLTVEINKLETYKYPGDWMCIASAYIGIGNIHYKQSDYTLATQSYEAALEAMLELVNASADAAAMFDPLDNQRLILQLLLTGYTAVTAFQTTGAYPFEIIFSMRKLEYGQQDIILTGLENLLPVAIELRVPSIPHIAIAIANLSICLSNWKKMLKFHMLACEYSIAYGINDLAEVIAMEYIKFRKDNLER